MAQTTISPNMNLIVPTASECSGPAWAQDLNASLSIIDQHNHSPGSGVQVSQDGIALSASGAPYDSLAFNSTNAFGLRSVRFTPQLSALALATDLGCLYEAGVDLYYNDGSGNQIRLTQGGSIVGTAGSITGLPSGTASASYSGGTFVWQSATSTAANMDAGSYIFRNSTASSKGLTLQPPNAMAADYSITLPLVPAATSFVTLDSSGNLSGSVATAGGITGSNIASQTVTASNIASGTITTTQISATAGILRSQLAAVGQQVSSASGSFVTTNASATAVTNLSVTLVTTGRPVMVMLQPNSNAVQAEVFIVNNTSVAGIQGNIYLLRDASVVSKSVIVTVYGGSATSPIESANPGTFSYLDVVASGSHTYSISASVVSGGQIQVNNMVLVAYEL